MARNVITFVDVDGSRKWLRFGRLNQREFGIVKTRVDRLVSARISGDVPDRETAVWLNDVSDYIREKLASAGLAEKRRSLALLDWIDQYVAKRTDVKPATLKNYRRTKRRLKEFLGKRGYEEFEKSKTPWAFLRVDRLEKVFGKELVASVSARTHSGIVKVFGKQRLVDFLAGIKELRAFTPGDAADWQRWAALQGDGPNTVRRQTGVASQFFAAAILYRLAEENPFQGFPKKVLPDSDRCYFVSLDESAAILAACPHVEWRLLFALARWGGLRVPSEPSALRWTDVDWERNRLTVHSPKTEHYPGGETRVIPLFPEIRTELAAAFDAAPDGAEFVFQKLGRGNPAVHFARIVARAGLTMWPKPFNNLRATRETELAETYPIHVVTKWIGNSEPVARKHYLQVTDDHYDRATGYAPHKAPQQEPKATGNTMKTNRSTARADKRIA